MSVFPGQKSTSVPLKEFSLLTGDVPKLRPVPLYVLFVPSHVTYSNREVKIVLFGL